MANRVYGMIRRLAPFVVLGLIVGRWFLPRVPQKAFDATVLVLAAIAAVDLVR